MKYLITVEQCQMSASASGSPIGCYCCHPVFPVSAKKLIVSWLRVHWWLIILFILVNQLQNREPGQAQCCLILF